jgi:succinate dehydrogenase/fumarate reductase flavoprotein subunit
MPPDAEHFDLVVLGAGAGGMTAAIVAATEGLRVLLIEKTQFVGGTTAISGGMVWVPENHLMSAAGLSDSREAARAYLAATVPDASARAALDAYLDAAPEAIRYLCERTEVRLRPVLRYPDYYPKLPGATLGGRVLEPEPFDGQELGCDFVKLRPPLQEFTILGGMMVARSDIPHFRNFASSPKSFLHVARLVVGHWIQRLSQGRGTSLVLGNALAGRLFLSARRARVEFRLATTVDELVMEQGRCSGVRIHSDGEDAVQVYTKKGVVIATGGFSHDPQRRNELMSPVAKERSATVSSAQGDGIRMGTEAGGALDANGVGPAFWVPVSSYTAEGDREVVYPHTVTDRAKPGVIAVDQTGCRFVNEAVSYHEFVRAMLHAPNGAAMRAHLICDRNFIWRYGLGAIIPFTRRLDSYLHAGYLKRADSISTLAKLIAVNPAPLSETVSR